MSANTRRDALELMIRALKLLDQDPICETTCYLQLAIDLLTMEEGCSLPVVSSAITAWTHDEDIVVSHTG